MRKHNPENKECQNLDRHAGFNPNGCLCFCTCPIKETPSPELAEKCEDCLANNISENHECPPFLKFLVSAKKKLEPEAEKPVEEWIERFDKEIGYCTRTDCVDLQEIKAFITQTILSERKALKDKIQVWVGENKFHPLNSRSVVSSYDLLDFLDLLESKIR